MDKKARRMLDKNSFAVGAIKNCHGGLCVSSMGGKRYWRLEDFAHDEYCKWEEIPEYLFTALVRFKDGDNG